MEIGYRDHRRTVDLDAPLATVVIGQIVKGDANADRFVLEMKNGGKSADLSGYSADGLFINRLGMEVPLRATVSGSEIEMVLTGGCYDVGGAAVGHVRLVSSDASQIRTVIRFVADVTRDGSGVAYDPDGVIGDLDALLAKLTAMETATADGIAAAQEARNAGTQAIADANAAGDAAKTTAQAAADDATAAAETARSTIYTRAMAIPDESALAASHELHAQRDYPFNVAVHGFTYQEGEGDPSPENVRPIHGLDAAKVHAGGKNLLPLNGGSHNGITAEVNGNGITVSGTAVGNSRIFLLGTKLSYGNGVVLLPGTYYLSLIRNYETVEIRAYRTKDNFQLASQNTSFTLYEPTEVCVFLFVGTGITATPQTVYPQIEFGSTATPYEPYNATVINPPLLPDNSPLMEGDTVENWGRSGCDKKIVLDGSEAWYKTNQNNSFFLRFDDLELAETYNGRIGCNMLPQNSLAQTGQATGITGYPPNAQYPGQNWIYITISGITAVGDVNTEGTLKWWLNQNRPTVYYRSTDYTPDKDLKVCRVTRQYYTHEFDGTEPAPISIIQETQRFTIDINGKPGIYNNGFCTHFIESAAAIGMNNVNNAISCYNTSSVYLRADMFATTSELQEFFVQQKANGTPVTYTYKLATPEIYMTDPLPLLPPAALESDTVTVTGSGETEVEYAHDTKHFIIDFVTKALASQS